MCLLVFSDDTALANSSTDIVNGSFSVTVAGAYLTINSTSSFWYIFNVVVFAPPVRTIFHYVDAKCASLSSYKFHLSQVPRFRLYNPFLVPRPLSVSSWSIRSGHVVRAKKRDRARQKPEKSDKYLIFS